MADHSREVSSLYMFSSVRKRSFPAAIGRKAYRIPVHMLCLVTEGEGILLLDGVLCRIYPLQLYLLVPGMMIEVPEQSVRFDYYGVFFEPLMITKTKHGLSVAKEMQQLGSFLPGPLPLAQPQRVLQHILQLQEDSKGVHKKDPTQLRIQLEELVYEVASDTPVLSTMKDQRIEKVITFMEQHFTDKISMNQMAAAGGISTVAFSKTFRKMTGIPPVEYLNHIRLMNAKKMLDEDHRRVKEIAAAVGFNSEFYFSRIFQRVVGVSPTVYMKRGQLKVAVASSLGFHNHLQALGIEAVQIVDLLQYPGMQDQEYQQLLAEQLRQLSNSEPELIIADHYHTEFRDSLKKIASTVYIDSDGWDWKQNFMKIAELMNREQEADVLLTRLQLRISDVGLALREAMGDDRLTIIQVNHRAIGIQGLANHPLNELIYSELGLKAGPDTPADEWRVELQPEWLDVLDAEHLFIHKHHLRAGSEAVYQRLAHTSSWSQITAVRLGNVRIIDNWFVHSWTLQGRQLIMEQLLDLFKNDKSGIIQNE
ncbi:AraC family transcriptional regulator [Paenibacillus herberti]|uniref:AraC family transcriptional regulator n=1 Tax=Paenibacillus herberti TaxID=1619309 RepID=A0A229NXM7_9BACL|nr:AraC family transcriptional regulator [Paenibacillus herberti]OXM14650.1 hypothetical protein CGZ75_17200 [Paenibacillus herberti]